jgi:hypothetical protein
MYNEEVLRIKYKMSKKEVAIVKSCTFIESPKVDVNFNIYELPDYLLVHVRKYGITSKDMQDGEEKLNEILSIDESLKDEKEKIIHQIMSYYNKLKQKAIKDINPVKKETYL